MTPAQLQAISEALALSAQEHMQKASASSTQLPQTVHLVAGYIALDLSLAILAALKAS